MANVPRVWSVDFEFGTGETRSDSPEPRRSAANWQTARRSPRTDCPDRRKTVLVAVCRRIIILRTFKPFVPAVRRLVFDLPPQIVHFHFRHRRQVASDIQILPQVFNRFDPTNERADWQLQRVTARLPRCQTGLDHLTAAAKTFHPNAANATAIQFG